MDGWGTEDSYIYLSVLALLLYVFTKISRKKHSRRQEMFQHQRYLAENVS
jgi:hypothetical protein